MNDVDPAVLSIAFQDKRLCTRCGTCIGACPVGALSIGEACFPQVDEAICTRCGLCRKTCPGGRVSYTELTELTFGHRDDDVGFDGHVRAMYFGQAGDAALVSGGAGGGVITALLGDLLDRGVVDGCLVTRMQPGDPSQGEATIARSREALLESQQSKYIVIPMNEALRHVRDSNERFAMAGLPCHIHGLRLLCREQPALAERIHCVIGLFCAGAMEPYIAREMMAARGVDPAEVVDFKFRDGEWPGHIRAIMKDGERRTLHQSNFKDGAINYMTYLYLPPRCRTCIDGSAEFADVAVSDAWTRDAAGNYVAHAHSRLLVRTERGEQVVGEAMASGALRARDVSSEPAYRTHQHHRRKKGLSAYLRVARQRRAGQAVPEYDRPTPASTWRDRWLERMESALMRMGEWGGFRRPLFAVLTSRVGLPLIRIRQALKRRRYRGQA